jgi:hypothetical protein
MALLEFLSWILGCEFLSDLHVEPYHFKAIILLGRLNLKNYSHEEINEAKSYLNLL